MLTQPYRSAPIVSTLEVLTGIDARAAQLKPNRFNQSKALTRLLQIVFRVLICVGIVALAIAIPSFELVSALMGGLFGYLICIIIPLALHLKMFQGQLRRRQILLDWELIIVAALLGISGTVWEFLPQGWISN